MFSSSQNGILYSELMATDDYFAAAPAKNAAMGKICLLQNGVLYFDLMAMDEYFAATLSKSTAVGKICLLYSARPEKPMKAIDISAAVISTMGAPRKGFGRSLWLIRSRMLARSTMAIV